MEGVFAAGGGLVVGVSVCSDSGIDHALDVPFGHVMLVSLSVSFA
jgi:hypothetical protein